jgi:putative DNA methylase
MPGAAHFVTYRLAGTIPAAMVCRWRDERNRAAAALDKRLPDYRHRRDELHERFFMQYDEYLDTRATIDWLTQPAIATMLEENLHHHDGSKYVLLAYCIMPNHAHVVLYPLDNALTQIENREDRFADEMADAQSPLAQIMHSLKSYTANKANQLLHRSGTFWQRESYDHWVRDEAELVRIVEYVAMNPVRAELAPMPWQWRWSSAHRRFERDGAHSALLIDL